MGIGVRLLLGAAASLAFAAGAEAQVVAPYAPIVYTPNIGTLTTGTVLDVSPAVSADDRYVTLNLHLEFSSLNGIDTFPGVGGGGGVGAAGAGFGVGGVGTIGVASVSRNSSFGVGAYSQQIILNSMGRAVAIGRVPYRPNEVGPVTVVVTDKALANENVPAIALTDVSMQTAVQRLADASKANIVVGWKALKEAKIDALKVHPKVDISQGSLRDSLVSLLNQTAPEKYMVVTFEDNVAFITTQAQADTMVVTRWYYTADLLANAPRWMSNQTDLDKVGTARVNKPVAAAPLPSLFAPGTYPKPPAAPVAAAAPAAGPASPSTNIIALITSTVRPEIWKCNGGKYGEISVVRDRVMVTAPESVQALLDGPKYYNPNAAPLYVNYQQ